MTIQNDSIQKELDEICVHVDGIEKYICINNIEVIGLTEPGEERREEKLFIDALNALPGIDAIISDDIDSFPVL